MGAMLGALLALSLLATRTHGILEMIVNSAAPGRTMVIFVGTLAAMVAVGAMLTGWIFLAMEER